MLPPLPHPRNDQDQRSDQAALPQEPLAFSESLGTMPSPSEHVHFPSTNMSQARIDEARRVLSAERCGVSYRDVLQKIAELPWLFLDPDVSNNVPLTEKLIQCNPSLLNEYNQRSEAEGRLAKLLALIPLVGRPTESFKFLQSHRDVNQIIHDMRDAGLLEVCILPPYVPIATRHLSYSYGPPSLKVSVSDLGRLALNS